MKIVADENIPLVKHYFGASGELVLKPGRSITSTDVVDADILLVRSVTPVNQALLEHSQVKFVGSATTGVDHLDTQWLTQANIPWAAALGSNATAVVEYVLCIIAALRQQGKLLHSPLRAGVIGVGKIGSQVATRLQRLGMDVVLCDPIRAALEKDFSSVELAEFADLDFITLHTPLTQSGPYPTHHLINKTFLQRQKTGCVLLNSSRGSVINFADLKRYGERLTLCLDVWENEPAIDLEILARTMIATPHIAGYSVQAKYRGIEMIYQAALANGIIPDKHILAASFPRKALSLENRDIGWEEKALQIYDPLKTSLNMKHALQTEADSFDQLRKNFPERFEFEFVDFTAN